MHRLSAFLAPAGATVLSVVAVLAVALRPVPGAPLLAWFGADGLARAVSADALPVAPGPLGSLLLRGEGDLAARLSASGAWLVLRADALGGCLMSQSKGQTS
ncbi:hypothetical protein [Elioraea rosea]|uniref:hypothetical protein n=1 Tax=Elioraea rosea TaxID=2492390 RepID=UPI001182D0F7|nr:hypothetical protein [Elioraea rosea]